MTAAEILRYRPMTAADVATQAQGPLDVIYGELIALEAQGLVRVLLEYESKNREPIRRWELMA